MLICDIFFYFAEEILMGCHNVKFNGTVQRMSQIFIRYSISCVLLLCWAYVNIFQSKYWRTQILAFFALITNIAKFHQLPNFSIIQYFPFKSVKFTDVIRTVKPDSKEMQQHNFHEIQTEDLKTIIKYFPLSKLEALLTQWVRPWPAQLVV